MENPRTDQQLLRDYLKSGDQRAFRNLAERYSGLIYHTALRVSNNRTLAEDASQRVLGALAEKAGTILRDGIPLSAWLHRATILETKSLRRSEARHHRKKEALMLEPTDDFQLGRSTPWHDALPQLDAAIDSLSETDRRVVLLHYVDGMTFPEVARRLNKSAAAVQKQSRRALERLQKLLGKRGVTLSIGILAAGLTAEMAKAAPLTLLTSLGSIQTYAGTTQILTVKKTTIAAIGATVLLCGVPLAKQHLAIRDLEKQLTRPATAGFQPPARARTDTQATPADFLKDLAEALRSQNTNVGAYLDALNYLKSLSNDELIALPGEVHRSSLQVSEQATVIQFAISNLSDRDRELALNTLLETIPRSLFEANYGCDGLLRGILWKFSDEAPQDALAWFENHIEAIRQLPMREHQTPDRLESTLRCALSIGFIFTDPVTCVEILRPTSNGELGNRELVSHLDQITRSYSPSLGKNPDGFIAVSRALFSEEQSNDMIARIPYAQVVYGRNGTISYENYDRLLNHDDLTSNEKDAIARWAGLSCIGVALQRPPQDHLKHYREWLEERGYGQLDQRLGDMLALKMDKWSAQSNIIYSLLNNREKSGISDQTVITFLEKSYANNSIRSTDLEKIRTLPNQADNPAAVQAIVDQIESKYAR